MLVSNKLSLQQVAYPALLANMQFCFATIFLLCLAFTSNIKFTQKESKLWPWVPYSLLTATATYANLRALQNTTIMTMVVIRSLCPLLICWVEWSFLGQKVTQRIPLSLLAAGGLSYVCASNSHALLLERLQSCSWSIIWGCATTFATLFSKYTEDAHSFGNIWMVTLLSNALGIIPLTLIGVAFEAHSYSASLFDRQLDTATCLPIVVSCLGGVAIGWATWKCRSLTTLSCFAVLGVLTKANAVLMSFAVTDETATGAEIASLLCIISASASYQHTPMRDASGRETSLI